VHRIIALALALIGAAVPGQTPPLRNSSTPGAEPLRFAVVGDAGTGGRPQFEVGEQLATARTTFRFDLVILLGDNMYGGQRPQDFVDKFERPYAPLLRAGVRFFATLGNHDDQNNRFYPGFNMDGQRYYSFARQDVRFIILDTNLLDSKQLKWFEQTLSMAKEPWKIAYFHHPLYSNGGRHGSNFELRVALEPLLVKYGVNVVFSGHEHIYERLKPQKGITYFVAGSGGQLRKGDLEAAESTAAGFDQDQVFVLVEVTGNQMVFRAVSRTGAVVDSGVIGRRGTT
jgi:predicted MPP superfamily phosphohydrolase